MMAGVGSGRSVQAKYASEAVTAVVTVHGCVSVTRRRAAVNGTEVVPVILAAS